MMDYRRFRDINDFFANGQPEKARRLLMEIQARCLALRDEINMLKLRLETAEDALFLSRNLARDGRFYWLKMDGVKQGPFCPRCYEGEGALIRLERINGLMRCPYCQEDYAPELASPGASDERPGLAHARILPFARQQG